MVNFAREAPIVAKLCNDTHRTLVVVSDETCHLAKAHTDLVIHARTRSGLFLESTVAITAILNLLVHAVAEQDSTALAARLDHWNAAARALSLF